MSDLEPPRRPRAPRRSHLTPEQLKEVNRRRNQAGNNGKSVEVNKRLASRLVSFGWRVFAPDGTEWKLPEDPADTKKRDWHKY